MVDTSSSRRRASCRRRAARPQMVATEARKARRLAAALAKTGAADPTAHVKPPAPDARGGVRPLGRPYRCREETGVCRHGVEEERGYTPPAILRAVANAARNKEAKDERVQGGGPARRQVRLGLPRVR